jgi:exosome complex exonuclease DIS3/RRP44
VVVHRLLAAALGLHPLPDAIRDKELLRGVAENNNLRHHNAQMAGRASVELHTLIFFTTRALAAEARITKVRPSSF